MSGYNPGDYDMNGDVDNSDKNELWIPNSGRGTQIPGTVIPDGGYKSQVPK